MAIRGSLKEASLPDVLQLLSLGQKTGCLSITHRNNFGAIYFDRGLICFASLINRRDRLGDLLVKSGRLTAAQLDTAIAAQARHPDLRLGDILVQQGMLSRDALHEHIRVQIEEAVYYLFTWSEGSFNFEPDLRPEMQDFLVAVRPDALLLEGARRVDEWSLIEKKVPSFDIVFDLDRQRLSERGLTLTREQEVVASLIDGRRDVHQIVHESGLVEFDVGKALYGLATAGFLHRVGTTRTPELVVPDADVDAHRTLGIAFYKTGMFDEAIREFRRVTELRPRDEAAPFHVALALARLGRWNEADAAANAAAAVRNARGAVWHNRAYVLERMGRLDDAQDALNEAAARGLDGDPRTRTSFAMVALRRGEVPAADHIFTEARALFEPKPPTPAWYHGAALAAALQGELERARVLLEEALERYAGQPHTAVLANNLAVVLERLGRTRDALDTARRAVALDAGQPQPHKNAGDLYHATGRFDDALEAYARAVRAEPDLGPDVYVKVGAIHAGRAERDDAIRAWERALELDPDNSTARANLAAANELTT